MRQPRTARGQHVDESHRPATREERYRGTEADLWSSLGVGPEERFVELPRLRCRVRVQALGSGPDLLFVHGATTCGTSWAGLAARLPQFRCLLLDRPGTGLSAPLPERVAGPDALRALAPLLVPDVLDALGLARADLVVTSFGGLFGFAAAATVPERIGRMASLGWTAAAPPGRLPLAIRIGSTPPFGRLAARLPVTEASVRRLLATIGLREAIEAGRVGPAELRCYAALLRDSDTALRDIEIGGSVLTSASGVALETEVLARVAAPVLLVWGDRDPFGDTGIARAFAAGLPDARLEILPGVGHAPWMDDPVAMAALVGSFLGS